MWKKWMMGMDVWLGLAWVQEKASMACFFGFVTVTVAVVHIPPEIRPFATCKCH